ncbi:MAG: RluA family pseudouridine synthase [Pseudomonadota bacterium]
MRAPGVSAPASAASDPYAPPHGPLRIVHRDTSLCLVEKPPGLLSVPGKGAGGEVCLHTRLVSEDPSILLVHRLDRDTSGLMVFARTKAAQRHLGLQFEKRHVEKRYVAWVAGEMGAETGVIDLPLRADWPNRPRQMVCHAQGKPAETAWHVRERRAGATRVALMPRTGRSHQLRVHMAALGHPILGDPLYGPDAGHGAVRLMLHAEGLSLRHPEGGAPCAFEVQAAF